MLNDWPKISIVTPSYNHRPFIETVIRSVVEQDYPNFEYFVMDGGSNDGSQEIIEKYSAAIDYWCSEPDEGQSHAIAKGFARATGDVLAWINSDDAYFPGALKKVGRFFAEHPDVDLVTAGTAYTDVYGRITSCYERPASKVWFAKRGIMYYGQQAMFLRRQIYEQVGGIRLDLHYLMDTELLLRILLSGGKCGAFCGLCGFFRWHERMKSIRRLGRKAEEIQMLREEYNRGVSVIEKFLALIVFRLWQLVNGNYLLSLRETMALKGKSIDEIWGWNNDRR